MMQQPEAACAHLALLFGLAAATAVLGVSAARAETIQNPIAMFAALDKVTGRISHLEIPINQTVQFGALKVTPRVCNTRPPTEAPHTTSFVEVDEIKLTGEVERIFTGWMFADSPGLHAVEHPVFDVWLTNCKTNEPVAPAGSEQNARRLPRLPQRHLPLRHLPLRLLLLRRQRRPPQKRPRRHRPNLLRRLNQPRLPRRLQPPPRLRHRQLP